MCLLSSVHQRSWCGCRFSRRSNVEMHDTDFLSADNWKWPAAFSWRQPGYEKHWGPPPPHIHRERFVDLNKSVNFSLGNDISASKWMKIRLKFWQKKNTSDKYGQLWIKCTLIFTPSLLLEPCRNSNCVGYWRITNHLYRCTPPPTASECVDVRHQTKCYLLFLTARISEILINGR